MPMLTNTKPRQSLKDIPITIAIAQLSRPIRFSPMIQHLLDSCGPQPAIGGRYAAWVHGLLPCPGRMVIYQDPNRAIPLSAHPSIQIRHDCLNRRSRAIGQLTSLIDTAADMVTFAHGEQEAIHVANRFLALGGDGDALAYAIATRQGRIHERAMLRALNH